MTADRLPENLERIISDMEDAAIDRINALRKGMLAALAQRESETWKAARNRLSQTTLGPLCQACKDFVIPSLKEQAAYFEKRAAQASREGKVE